MQRHECCELLTVTEALLAPTQNVHEMTTADHYVPASPTCFTTHGMWQPIHISTRTQTCFTTHQYKIDIDILKTKLLDIAYTSTVYIWFIPNIHCYKSTYISTNWLSLILTIKSCAAYLANKPFSIISFFYCAMGRQLYDLCRAPSSKEWNFRTKFLENFRTISGHFCRFHEAQDTENARFSVLINVTHWSRSVLQS